MSTCAVCASVSAQDIIALSLYLCGTILLTLHVFGGVGLAGLKSRASVFLLASTGHSIFFF